MTGTGAHTGSSLGDAVRKGVGLVHGSGEAIRGNINAAVDSATGDRESAAKNEAIASRGIDEAEHGHYHGTGTGVTPVDTATERQNRAAQGEYSSHTHTHAPTTSTNHGPHTTNTANKLDPQYDSNLDHRGVVETDGTPSSFHRSRQINTGDNLTPHSGLDLNNRGTTEGSKGHWPRRTSTGRRVNSDLGSYDQPTNHKRHSSNTGSKVDPRYDSNCGRCGPATVSSNYERHGINEPGSHYDSDQDHRDTYTNHGSTSHSAHTNVANKSDPPHDSDIDHRGAGTYDGDIGSRAFEHAANEFIRGSIQDYGRAIAVTAQESESEYTNSSPPHSNFQRRGSEPMPYFPNTYKDIDPQTPRPLTHSPPQSRQQKAEKRLQRKGGRLPSNRGESPLYQQLHQQQYPKQTSDANVLSPRALARESKSQSHSTANPHKSSILNLLNPRVDQKVTKSDKY